VVIALVALGVVWKWPLTSPAVVLAAALVGVARLAISWFRPAQQSGNGPAWWGRARLIWRSWTPEYRFIQMAGGRGSNLAPHGPDPCVLRLGAGLAL